MITVKEAKQTIIKEIPKGPSVRVPLDKAWQRVLAEDVMSPLDSPLFDASAMDGFAIRHEETYRASRNCPSYFKNIGLIAAGDVASQPLNPNETFKVMTGAMIPKGTTAVIPQEEILFDTAGTLLVSREVERGENIRCKGEEIKKGTLALPKNTFLNAGAIGFLASLGVSDVPIYAPPKVFILTTGSELVKDISELTEGKIIESNSYSLKAALQEIGITPLLSSPVPDIAKVLHAVIEYQLQNTDFLLITGGVSVGVFDLVKEILAKQDVETLFWQVAQKPGKPLYFGRRENIFVFGLPGNPASSLVCFYEYVRPALLQWIGYPDLFLLSDKGKLSKPFCKKDERLYFVRARALKTSEGIFVNPLEGQESHRMHAFADANCLMVVPQEIKSLQKGDAVTIHWLPEIKNGEVL